MATSQTTPAPVPKITTKSGTDLATFEDVRLYKAVPTVPPVQSVADALLRLGNDNARLLSIINEGLQSEAIEKARQSDDGWMLLDENGKETTEAYTGSLANSEDVNPVVLMFAKLMFGYDEAAAKKDADGKRAAKDKAREAIKGMPQVLDGLRAKAQKSA